MRSFLIACLLMLSPSMATAFTSVCARSEVLRNALVEKLGVECKAIGPRDLMSITDLSLRGATLDIVAGEFEGLINLRLLDLSDANVVAVAFLEAEGMPALETLILTNAMISAFELSNLLDLTPNLRKLIVTQPDDIVGLNLVPKLEVIHLKRTLWESIRSGLDDLKRVKVLGLSDNPGPTILSRTFLRNFPTVETLVLHNNSNLNTIHDDAFVDMPKLKRVDVHGTPLGNTRKAAFRGVQEVVGLPPAFDVDGSQTWGGGQ